MTKRAFLPLTLALVAAGCPSDSADGSGSTSDATDTDPTVPDPTVPDPTTPDPTTGETDPDPSSTGPDDTGSADESSTGSADESSESTGEPDVDPADLPFGGFVSWAVRDTNAFGDARFYEIEYPDHPDYEPWSWELPLGDTLTEDDWSIVAETEPLPKGIPDPTYTDLELSPQFFLDGGGLSFTMELDATGNVPFWDMGFHDLERPYPGGAWTVEFPAHGDFPAATYTDIVPGPAGDAAEFTHAVDADGVPTSVTWNPLDAHLVQLTIFLLSPDGVFQFVCRGRLADDGEVELPAACRTMEGLDLDPALDTYVLSLEHQYHKDVAYGDHRLRIQFEVDKQIVIVYPFEPV